MSSALQVRGLRVEYGSTAAVRGIDFDVGAAEVYALIGETGSGKSSAGLAIARLLPPSASVGGRVVVEDVDISDLSSKRFRPLRASMVGFVPQDAMAALNPLRRVGRQIAEIMEVHLALDRREAERRAVDELRLVRISDPREVSRLYPHQLSGGMRQRVMIAMALALRPILLVADEPTTALDVNTQAEILRLVSRLRRELGTAVLWITHDMGVVAELADRVGVMYAGRIVEEATVKDVFDRPMHPYTLGLLRTLSSLRAPGSSERLYQIEGQPPSWSAAISGCPFHPRCPRRIDECVRADPPLERLEGRRFACHNPVPPAGVKAVG